MLHFQGPACCTLGCVLLCAQLCAHTWAQHLQPAGFMLRIHVRIPELTACNGGKSVLVIIFIQPTMKRGCLLWVSLPSLAWCCSLSSHCGVPAAAPSVCGSLVPSCFFTVLSSPLCVIAATSAASQLQIVMTFSLCPITSALPQVLPLGFAGIGLPFSFGDQWVV